MPERLQGKRAAACLAAASLAIILASMFILSINLLKTKVDYCLGTKEFVTPSWQGFLIFDRRHSDSYPTQQRREIGRHPKIARDTASPKKFQNTLHRTAKVWRSLSERNWSKPQRGQWVKAKQGRWKVNACKIPWQASIIIPKMSQNWSQNFKDHKRSIYLSKV